MAVAINICATNSTVNNLSRNALLIWVNKTLSTTFKKIEDLSSGDAYCLLTNILFPQTISPIKIRTGSNLEYEHLNNWKLLQNAFMKLKVEKVSRSKRWLK
jgi:microtubule-associated protein, RP/EB family